MSQHAARTGRNKRPAAKAPAREPERTAESAESAESAAQPVAVGGLAVTNSSALLRSSEDAADPLGGAAIPGDIVSALRRQAGRGTTLPDQLSSQLGSELGGDVSAARLHTDAEADTLARSVSAVAFTYGTDIYFSAGSFNPESSTGQHLLAHELSHVVQAQQGTGGGAGGTIGAANDPAEQAAEASATRAVSALQRKAVDVPHEHAAADHAGSVGQPAAVRRSPSRTSGKPVNRPATGSGRVRLSVSAPHDDAAGAHSAEPIAVEAIRRLLVKVQTARTEDKKTRVITEVKVEGRAPTTVSGSQGDHTVAETLIVEAVQGICRFQEYWPAYLKLLQAIPTFAEQNKVDRYDAQQVYAEFSKTDEKTFREMDGEDQVASIEALIDGLIRAANKVPNSAFAKKEGVTSGGGKEKEAINSIRDTAMGGPLMLPTIFMIAEQLVELIDYTEFNQVLADRCVAAVQLACRAAPPLSTKQNLLVPTFVDALVQKRFPSLVGATDILLQAVMEGLGQSRKEVKLSEWGSQEAMQNPKAEGPIAPEFSTKLSEHGSPPVSAFNTTQMPTPKVVTQKLQGKQGAQTWGNDQIVKLADSWYLVVNSVSSSNGQTTYDVAKLEIHEEPVTDMGGAGPELGAFVPYHSQPHQIVRIDRNPKFTVYLLARVA